MPVHTAAASGRRPRELPEGDSALLPFLPLLYVAWSDGILSDPELRTLQDRIGDGAKLEPAALETLESWLDPSTPPDAGQLTALRERIRREARRVPEQERRSLASLGVAMGRVSDGDGPGWATAEGLRRLEAIEELLGVLGDEAARELLQEEGRPREPLPPEPLNVRVLRQLLDGRFAGVRERVLGLMQDDALRIPAGLERDLYRERVLDAVQHLADEGLGRMGIPGELGGEGDIPGSIVAFETLALGDLSVLVKFGVQFGLFGGSVQQLGTERHHRRFLGAIADLALPGCYAMTERDHGSNVRELETVARYLPDEGVFEVHTPHPGARKDWIGNAALHGRMATVFAQLETGGENHGVHALLVPLRDEAGQVLPGITIEDCGDKVGLQGVDNGTIAFDRVKVPRENLLDRFGQVTAEGRYDSAIASDGKRFFTMLGTLVTGRISIAAASVSAARTALTIAVRYSAERRQFGPSGEPEVPVLDYLTQQRLLLPRLAGTYALHFAVRDLVEEYGRVLALGDADSGADGSSEERGKLEVLAAGLKAEASRHAMETIQASREACGGRGYDARNRFGVLRDDVDVFTTFEGANVVLLQLVARGVLARFRDEVGDLRFWGMVRFLADRAGSEVDRRNPVRSRRTSDEHLRDRDTQREAFGFREQRLMHTVARRLKSRIDDGMDSFDAMNECQDHLVALARAHVERKVFESFAAAVERARNAKEALAAESDAPASGQDPNDRVCAQLTRLLDLWALSRIEDDRAWFIESGYMEPGQTRAIRSLVNRLCREIRPCALPLVDGFGIPDAILAAPDGIVGPVPAGG